MKLNSPTNYATSIKRLEEIITKIEGQELDIDVLANHVKEANELIKFCSAKLNEVNQEVENLLAQDKKGE